MGKFAAIYKITVAFLICHTSWSSLVLASLVGMNIYKLQLSKYDTATGKITEISKPIGSDKELTFEMQGSLATGSDDGIYYGLFYNYTSIILYLYYIILITIYLDLYIFLNSFY